MTKSEEAETALVLRVALTEDLAKAERDLDDAIDVREAREADFRELREGDPGFDDAQTEFK